MSQWPKTSHVRNIANLLHRLCVSFVDRYIPGYIFFGDTVENGYIDGHGQTVPPPWKGKALRILIGTEREVVGSVAF